MRNEQQTAVAGEESRSGNDWPLVAFFAIAYGLAWGLILVFNALAAEQTMDLTAVMAKRQIQVLMGHRRLSTTMIYLHVSRETLSKIPSPLDLIDTKHANKEDSTDDPNHKS